MTCMTVKKMRIPNQTVFITVPQGATLHIGDIALHHLLPERYEAEIEMVDAFLGHDLDIGDSL